MINAVHRFATFCLLGCAASLALADQPASAPTPQISLLPRVAHLEERTGTFAFTTATPIRVEKGDADRVKVARYLASLIQRSTGQTPPIAEVDAAATPGASGANAASGASSSGALLLATQGANAALGHEGYTLDVTPDGITIRAAAPAGLFYGVQTLLQLLPPGLLSKGQAPPPPWTVPAVHIEDAPRFGWRGMMVDTGRHFFTKAELLDFLDVMALHKFNTFHWHINDDPGWRIEVKKYPKLTEIGAWRPSIDFGLDPNSSTAYNERGQYGGFYTQDDVREIVAYAADRFIQVVPEFELPAHCEASRRAYPELGCDDPAPEPNGTVHSQPKLAYCPGKEHTFEVLQDILTEILPLFPCPIVHVGGDECDKTSWKACPRCQERMKAEGLKNEEELQSYFVRRMEKFLNGKQRRLLGWSEIQQGGIAPNALLMDWIGGAVPAAKSGHDVVMSPTGACYLDYYQAHEGEPKAIGGYLPLHTVYAFEPVPRELNAEEAKHILGLQGNMWTEYIANYRYLQYMAFPRACAIAETAWSPLAGKDFGDFFTRLQTHTQRLAARGVNFRPPTPTVPVGNWTPAQMPKPGDEPNAPPQFKVLEWDVTAHVTAARPYWFEFLYDRGACRLDIAWAALAVDGKEVARDAHPGTTGAARDRNEYRLPLDKFVPGAKYLLRASVRSDGGTDSAGTVWLRY